MKRPDYKNWMPKGMILAFFAGAVICLLVRILIGTQMTEGRWRSILSVLFLIAAVILSLVTLWCYALYRAFDYNGKRQMSKQIIEGIADKIDLKKGGKVLDVGCGSGALAIAVAKRHPEAEVIGIDRWGREYASFSLKLCQENAEAEGVSNVSFRQGDALRLDFADETFDVVVSNYVYHNIPSKDRQAIVLETLRTLKKGGQFALHDIFSFSKYGDMDAFVKKLKDMGYEKVELIDTANGMWISKTEGLFMELAGSALLKGIK